MTAVSQYRTLQTDILILGAGGAGLFAALHANQVAPELSITIAVFVILDMDEPYGGLFGVPSTAMRNALDDMMRTGG